MNFCCIGILITCVIFKTVSSNSISSMNMIDENGEGKCAGPTICFIDCGEVYTVVFSLRVDRACYSKDLKWTAVIGKPRRYLLLWKRYEDDQLVFDDYSLCPDPEYFAQPNMKDRLILSKDPCPEFYIEQKRYSVVVYNVQMPTEEVTDKFYLSDGHDAGTLGLEIRKRKYH